ncbi:MAG: hydroxyethylthiazole kinase [Firmicutes bacterium]|jgi:hydroxyethylthiazole kinase|nr:hydroxyethylthiazole kinase [Bacillota bacterium]MDH7495310.1 hydroxyethylthiazole kinase [Bacillota bacterium]
MTTGYATREPAGPIGDPSLVARIPEVLRKVREQAPLVHHITNVVVTNITANVTLAVGASPVMAHALEEVCDMASAASALVLNIGTLTPELVEAMILAGKTANERSIPVVLDPVGAGATPLRTKSVERILSEVRVSVLRGNEAEVSVIGGFGATIKGVDSVSGHHDKASLARETARKLGCVVAVTGAADFVSDGDRLAVVENGHPLLRHVTGTGCMATSVVAAFAAVEGEGDLLLATAGALAYYGYAAELAAARSEGPGSFEAALFDCLFNMTPEELGSGLKVRM